MANLTLKVMPENLIHWSCMEDWVNGASAAPTEHTLSGAGATIAQESTIVKSGTYSAAVTRVGADTTLYHDYPDYSDYQEKKMTFGCWVYATVASRARLSISDGVGSTNSSYHTGGSSWEYLTVTHDVDTAATRIRVEMQVNTGNTTAYFDGGALCEGTSAETVLSDTAAIAEWVPSTKFVTQEFRIARRGLKIPNIQPDSKSLRIRGDVQDTTQTAARTKYDTIMKVLASYRSRPDYTVQFIDFYLFDDRYIRGALTDISPEITAGLLLIPFEVSITAEKPFFYYMQKLRKSQALSGDTSFTVTTNGSAPSIPKITITNSSSNITSLTWQNLTTGESFSYTGSLATGQDLVVCSNKFTVENNGITDISNFSGDLNLQLYPGDNKILVTGLASGTCKVDWFDRWY